MPSEEPAADPLRPFAASLLAGIAAGGWLGVADGIRAAFEAPRPFGPVEFTRGAAAFALGGALLGALAWPVARRAPAPGAVARWLAPHVAVLLFVVALLRFVLFWRWDLTGTAVGQVALRGLVYVLAAAALALSFRARVRAAAARASRARVLVAAAVAPLALAAAAAAAAPWREVEDPRPAVALRSDAPPPPNVLIVLTDTLRADRVGAGGGAAGLTPSADALALEGVAFLQARTTSSWTKPSITSLLTGLRPERHGVLRGYGAVPEGAPLLASLLRGAGYRTAIFSDSHWPAPEFGFDRGIDGPHVLPDAGGLRATLPWRIWAQSADRRSGAHERTAHAVTLRGSAALADGALAWIDSGGPRPWFAYLHGVEPHAPYAPRSPSEPGRRVVRAPEFRGVVPLDSVPDLPPAERRGLTANYDDEVREADGALGRIVEGLRGRGILDRTLVVFLADHGEEFHEHGGWHHGHGLFEEILRIPLVLRLPGGHAAGRRVASAVRIEDVLPTVLEVAGIRTAATFDGESLLPLLDGGPAPDREFAAVLDQGETRARCVVSGRVKLMHLERGGRTERRLFDLAVDPAESRDLAATGDSRLPALVAALEASARLQAAGFRPGPSAAGLDLHRALQGLGYVGGAEDR